MNIFKKSISPVIVLLICFLLFNTSVKSQCDAKQVARISEKSIERPYLYSNSNFKPIVFDPQNEKVINIEFTAFKDVKYKIIFCASNFEEKVDITVYEKNKTNKKVFDNIESIDNNFWIFEPAKHGKYNIEYVVRKSSSGEATDGCVIMIVGFSQ